MNVSKKLIEFITWGIIINRLLWQEAACSLSRENACLKQALGHTNSLYTAMAT